VLANVFADASNRTVEPYVDRTSSQPLVASPPPPATIADTSEIKELGVTEWKLSNGVRVILKPTDFKNDQILFTSFSPGGSSLVPDSEYVSAITATSIVQEGGVGTFDQIALQKLLSGKIVQVSPSIGELSEGISGSCSPTDLESMFQLIYLYFTGPRADTTAFESYRARMKGFIQNRNARPESALDDTIQVTMGRHSHRRRPMSEGVLDEMDLKTSLKIYRERFADPSGFTFVFVGAFTPSGLEPFVKAYLGGIPSLRRNESWRDLDILMPEGRIEKAVKKGIEPKSSVRTIFHGPFSWSQEHRYELNSLITLLQIKLREALSEEKGGTYGVTVSGIPIHYPRTEYRTTISFGCAPERVEELTAAALGQVDSLRQFGTTTEYLTRVKEIQRRERETNLKENWFWLNVLQFYSEHGENPLQLLEYEKQIESLTSAMLQEAAKKYFDTNNYARFVLHPEKD
jgi:zinc protease